LRTGIGTFPTSNVDYYPSVNIANQDSASVSVPLPSVPFQGLTIMNGGVNPDNSWTDTTNSLGGYDAMYYDVNSGYVWLSVGNQIYVLSSNLNSIQQYNLSISGTSSGSSGGVVKCFYNYGGFMWIGGDFTTVVDGYGVNAQAQYGISRINLNSGVGNYYFEPIADYGTSNFGVNGYVNTIFGGNKLYVGGSFNSFAPTGTPCYNILNIDGYGNPVGSQTIGNEGDRLSTNAEVNCLAYNGGYGYVLVGGSFSAVDVVSSPQYYQYMAFFNSGSISWDYVEAYNAFNAPVLSCGYSGITGNLLVAGVFSTPYQYNCYVNFNSPNTPTIASGLTTGACSKINYISTYARDLITDDNRTVYKSVSAYSWTNLGDAGAGVPSAIMFNGSTEVFVAGTNPYVRQNNNVAQTATFALPTANFRTNGVAYTNASLSTKYQAQQFIADETGTYYYPVGNPICGFS